MKASAPKRIKLEGGDRTEQLKSLMDAGWKEVEGRDAIQKVFMFKNFNQVSVNRHVHRNVCLEV